MSKINEIGKRLTMIGQFGLSLIMPLMICILGCYYITYKWDVGTWIYIPGFILGLGSSFMTAYKFYLSERDKGENNKKKKTSFNRHI